MLELLRGCGWPRVGGRRGSSAGTRAGVDGRCFRTSEALCIAWIRAVASACLVDDGAVSRHPLWDRMGSAVASEGAIPSCFFIPSYHRRHTSNAQTTAGAIEHDQGPAWEDQDGKATTRRRW
jgi:hypothetical protein